jgi:hypothetical protein
MGILLDATGAGKIPQNAQHVHINPLQRCYRLELPSIRRLQNGFVPSQIEKSHGWSGLIDSVTFPCMEELKMRFPVDREFVEWAIRTVGQEAFEESIEADLAEAASPGTITEYLTGLTLKDNAARGIWDRAKKEIRAWAPDHPESSAFRDTLTFLALLQPDIDIDPRFPPWNRWQRGSEVAVVLGKRGVDIRVVSEEVKQTAVGARDVQSLALLSRICHQQLRLDCCVVPHHVPNSMSAEEAEAHLAELQGRKEVGMVVVLGSPVVNPLALPVARAIREEAPGLKPDPPPVAFRWKHDPGESFLSEAPCKRSIDDDAKWESREQGIAFRGIGDVLCGRVSDDDILVSLKKKVSFRQACKMSLAGRLVAGDGGDTLAGGGALVGRCRTELSARGNGRRAMLTATPPSRD